MLEHSDSTLKTMTFHVTHSVLPNRIYLQPGSLSGGVTYSRFDEPLRSVACTWRPAKHEPELANRNGREVPSQQTYSWEYISPCVLLSNKQVPPYLLIVTSTVLNHRQASDFIFQLTHVITRRDHAHRLRPNTEK